MKKVIYEIAILAENKEEFGVNIRLHKDFTEEVAEAISHNVNDNPKFAEAMAKFFPLPNKGEESIFSVIKYGEVEGSGFYMKCEGNDHYIGGIAKAVASYAVQNNNFYLALVGALEDMRREAR